MLILPIKRKWFDMILSGEKKEEYREVKRYYTIRLLKILDDFFDLRGENELLRSYTSRREYKISQFPGMVKNTDWYEGQTFNVLFRNGYSKDAPSFIAKCTLSVGNGKPEWGAEPGKEYYVFKILEIER